MKSSLIRADYETIDLLYKIIFNVLSTLVRAGEKQLNCCIKSFLFYRGEGKFKSPEELSKALNTHFNKYSKNVTETFLCFI